MPQSPSSPPCEVLACEVCLKDIPRDLAKSEEATGYVHYFCGDVCYARWQVEEKAEAGKKPA